jgi:hypothetical protein
LARNDPKLQPERLRHDVSAKSFCMKWMTSWR